MRDTEILGALAGLKGHYRGFRWESQLWEQVGHRRSPYRVLMLFGLSSRTKYRLLVSVCQRLFARCPDLEAFLRAWRDGREHLEAMVRKGQTPFLEAAARITQEMGDAVPADRETLMRVTGIGEKISECVMGYAWGKEALPVDGNVCRLVDRLNGNSGIGPTRNTTTTRRWLTRVFAENRPWMSQHGISLIDIHEILRIHAQLCCQRDPACAECPVAVCRYRRAEYSGSANSFAYSHLWDDWRKLILEPCSSY